MSHRVPDPSRTPPLGTTACPDPAWQAGRALVLQGPMGMLGALWVLELGQVEIDQFPPGPAPPPPAPPLGPEGSIPFVEDPATP